MLLRGRSGQCGNALVEFALVAPILLFIFLGMVVLGLAINSKIVVNSAAREAGRTFAITHDYGLARDRARDVIIGGGLKETWRGYVLFDPRRDVEVRQSGDYVYVTVTYRQPTFVPLLPRLLDPRASAWDVLAQLISTAVFRME